MIELNKNYSTTRHVKKMDTDLVIAEINAAHKPEDKFETVLFLPAGEGRQGEGGLRLQGYFKKNEENKPLITVITVVYNGEQFLEETILSVINQTYDNVEYIIIDGGSTDGTLDIIRKYEHAIDYWVSEKDSGIANAFNKGVQLAQGDWIVCLNADDVLMEESVFSIIMHNQQELSDYQFVYGNYQLVNREVNELIYESSSDFIYSNLIYGDILPHPALLTRRGYFSDFGCFDESFSIAMDYEWILRGISETNVHHVPVLITKIRDGGVSTQDQKLVISEILQALKKNSIYSSKLQEYWIVLYFFSRFYIKNILVFLGLYSLYKKIGR